MLGACFLSLVPGCVVVQCNGSVCVSLNINRENDLCSFRGQYRCANGWKIAWKAAGKGVVATGAAPLF